MKKIILTVAIVLCLVASVYCQGESLKLEIRTDKEVYALGEEIDIKCILINVSTEDITVCVYGLSYPKIGVKLDLIDSKGNNIQATERAIEYALTAPRRKDFKILKPNESIPFVIKNLDFGYYSYILNVPEKYFITVFYSNDKNRFYERAGSGEFINAWCGSIKSNTIAIEIK